MAAGSIRARGDDRFEIRVYAGRDPLTGRARYISRTVHGSRGDAERAVARLLTEVDDGRHARTSAATLGLLLERWLDHAAPDLAPYTLRGYRSKIDCHIAPALGDLPLRKITPDRLDGFYAALRQSLSPRSIRHVHAILHRALAQGRRWQWITTNPADLASPPSATNGETHPPTLPELVALLRAAQPDPELFDLVRLAIVTGARRGELCGLRWNDIDAERAELTIARAIVEPRRGVLEVRPPKTKRPRTIAAPAPLLAVLEERRRRVDDIAGRCERALVDAAYVLSPIVDGSQPLRPDLVTSRFRRLAGRVGLHCRFHDLRHFAVTFMLAGGIDAVEASGRVGHASSKMTLDVYGHRGRARDERAAEMLGRLIELDAQP